VTKAIAGVAPNAAGGVAINYATNCLTDKFSVTGNGGGNPNVICGKNDGFHSKYQGVELRQATYTYLQTFLVPARAKKRLYLKTKNHTTKCWFLGRNIPIQN
jgi:hypothetical protein